MVILFSLRSSALVNDALTRGLSIRTGVRQDDPLSLFMFITTMEALHVVMTKVVQKESSKVLQLLAMVLFYLTYFLQMMLFPSVTGP